MSAASTIALAAIAIGCSSSNPGTGGDSGVCTHCDGGGPPDAGDGAPSGLADVAADSSETNADAHADSTIDGPGAQTSDATGDGTSVATTDAASDGPSGTQQEAGFDAADSAATSGEGGVSGTLCGPGACVAGQVSCSGFCVSPQDPRFGCGSCTACAPGHATPACGAMGCAIASCETGWADCNGDPSDGCEADLRGPANCGACGTTCSGSTSLCAPSGCAASCAPPLTNCTDRCVDLTSDPYACGGCGMSSEGSNPIPHSFPTCTGGSTGLSCFAPYTLCGGACVDTTSDGNYCGNCQTSCPQTTDAVSVCNGSKCAPLCPAGWTLCTMPQTFPPMPGPTSACVTTEIDTANCGACGHACASGEVCAAGSCIAEGSLALVTGLSGVKDMVVDAKNVYFTDGSSNVESVPIAGGAAMMLAGGQQKPWGIQVDSTYVYWANNLGGAILRTRLDGTQSTPDTVVATTSPADIVLSGDKIYWLDSSNVMTAPKTPGGMATLARNVTQAGLIIGGPGGPFVAGTQPDTLFAIGAGWVVRTTSILLSLAQDGTYVYGASSPPPIAIFYYNENTGTRTGSVNPANCVATPTLLTGNACGVFYSCGAMFGLARAGQPFGSVLLNESVTAAAADAQYVYFFSGTSISKLPLP